MRTFCPKLKPSGIQKSNLSLLRKIKDDQTKIQKTPLTIWVMVKVPGSTDSTENILTESLLLVPAALPLPSISLMVSRRANVTGNK